MFGVTIKGIWKFCKRWQQNLNATPEKWSIECTTQQCQFRICLIHFVTERRFIIIRLTFRIIKMPRSTLGHRDYQRSCFLQKCGLRFIVVLLNNKARWCNGTFCAFFCFLRGTVWQHRVWFVVVFLIFHHLSFRKDWAGLVIVLLFWVVCGGEVVVLVLVGGGGGDPAGDGRRQVGGGVQQLLMARVVQSWWVGVMTEPGLFSPCLPCSFQSSALAEGKVLSWAAKLGWSPNENRTCK